MWKQLNVEELNNFIATFQLIGVYKSKGEPTHKLWSKDDVRPIYNAVFERNRFQEVLHMTSFYKTGEMRQNRSPDKLATIEESICLMEQHIARCPYPGFKVDC